MSDIQSMLEDIVDQFESIMQVMKEDIIDKYFEDEGKDSECSSALRESLVGYDQRLKEVHEAYRNIEDIVFEVKKAEGFCWGLMEK